MLVACRFPQQETFYFQNCIKRLLYFYCYFTNTRYTHTHVVFDRRILFPSTDDPFKCNEIKRRKHSFNILKFTFHACTTCDEGNERGIKSLSVVPRCNLRFFCTSMTSFFCLHLLSIFMCSAIVSQTLCAHDVTLTKKNS